MTDPQRFLDGAGDPFGRELLKSSLFDEGSAETEAKALAAWGAATVAAAAVGASIGSGAAASAATSAGSAGVGMVPSASSLGAVPWAVLAKWLGIGACAGLITATGVGQSFSHSGVPGVQAAAIPFRGSHGSPTRATQGPGPFRESVLAPVLRDEESLLSHRSFKVTEHAPTPAIQTKSLASAWGVSAPPQPSLAEGNSVGASSSVRRAAFPLPSDSTALRLETAYLDQARLALGQGRAAQALAALLQREKRLGTGLLAPEATVLTVEALLRLGRIMEARERAQQFLTNTPRGGHADRIRQLLMAAPRTNP